MRRKARTSPAPWRDRIVGLRRVRAGDLSPDKRNWRRHPEAQRSALLGVLKEIGWADALLARETPEGLVLVDGHLRAGLNADTVVPVLVLDLDETEAGKVIATLDPLASMAAPDQEALSSLLQAISFQDGAVNDMLEALANGSYQTLVLMPDKGPKAGLTDPDDAPEAPAEPWVKRGDVFQLGEHRVMCGDAGRDIPKFCGECDLAITDPPYGVSYSDKNRFLNAIGPPNRIEEPISGDMDGADIAAKSLWGPAFEAIFVACRRGAAFYCFAPQGGDQMMMMMMMKAKFNPTMHQLIWLKNNHVLGRVDYAYRHEPIIYTWKIGGHKFFGGFQTSVLEYDKPHSSKLHPTMKPVALIERLITNSSEENETVLDPFLGSGTTLIACERLSRICYGMEIEPHYVQVSLERWENYTGRKAVKVGNGDPR